MLKVRELLSEESKWTQGEFARDERGCSVSSGSDQAICWCLTGAILACYAEDQKFGEILDKVLSKVPNQSVIRWNDSHSFQEVRALIEELDI